MQQVIRDFALWFAGYAVIAALWFAATHALVRRYRTRKQPPRPPTN